ncbi:MAG: tetratricopeptide repeat protein [Planctomycetota bacterium]
MNQRLLSYILGLLLGAFAHSQQSPEIEALWRDPGFQKQFVAGYGINADVEPRVTAAEVSILEKIRPLMAEKLAEAELLLTGLMKPDCSAILDFTLGGMQFQQDRMVEALASYQKAVAKFPSFRRAWRNLGLIHTRNGAFDESIKSFTRMIELGGGDAYAYGLLGFAYSAKQDFQPAEAAYRNALLLQPENTEWRLGLTRCVFKQEKFEDAAALLDALLARYPDKADFWLLQAHTFLGMKRPLRAAENLELLDRLGKSTVDSLNTLGDIYVNEGLMDLALRAYERSIVLDPKQPIARPLRSAEILSARSAVPQARKLTALLREAAGDRLEPSDQRKLLKVEARLSMAEGNSSKATVAMLEEIVKLDPLDGEALMLLGQHYSRENEPDRAIFYYERAEGIEAFEANAKVRHAQVLVRLNRYAEAVPLLRRAQEQKPREDVARYLEQIDRVAKSKK